MTKADELREAINNAIPTSDLEWPGDAEVQTAIARAIVATLGIDRWMVDDLAPHFGVLKHHKDNGDVVTVDLGEAADALTALLEVADE